MTYFLFNCSVQLLSQTSIDLREAQGTCMLGRKNPLTLENQVASVERGRVWAVKTCSGLGISGQHTLLKSSITHQNWKPPGDLRKRLDGKKCSFFRKLQLYKMTVGRVRVYWSSVKVYWSSVSHFVFPAPSFFMKLSSSCYHSAPSLQRRDCFRETGDD